MGNSALVIGSHAVILTLFALVAMSWGGWFRRQWRTILHNPMGLIALGFAVLASWIAWEAVYYGTARVGRIHGAFDLWIGGFAPHWIAATRVLVIGAAMLLALIARWRIDEIPYPAIKVRLCTLVTACACLGLITTAFLW